MLIFKYLKYYFKFYMCKKAFNKMNKHNFTSLVSYPQDPKYLEKIKIGNYTYGEINVSMTLNENEMLLIGNLCSIGPRTKFILGSEHHYDTLTTYPFNSYFFNKKETITKGAIIIGHDVWIGENVTILSGVTIGQGAIIGAGSVVAKDIPPYSICYGNPVIIAKKRFSDKVIEKLLKIDFSIINSDFIFKNKELLTKKIDEKDLNIFLK